MAGSRDFNGRTDDIRFGLTSPNPTSAVTHLLVVRLDTVDDDTYVSASGYDPEWGREAIGRQYYRSSGLVITGTSATAPTARAWQVIAVTKAAGRVRPRFHRVLIGGAAAHEDGGGTLADFTPAAPWVLGGDGDRGSWQLDGQCTVWAVWNSALSDANIERCVTWDAIEALRPTRAVRLDGDPPFLGQTAINGTTHSSDAPAGFWPAPPAPTVQLNVAGVATECTVYVNVAGVATAVTNHTAAS